MPRRRQTAAPAMPKRGNGPQPSVSAPDSGICTSAVPASDERRRERVAAAAQQARQRVRDPDQHRAGEEDLRVGERLLQRRAAAAEQAVEPLPEAKQQQREGEAAAQRDDQGVRDQLARRIRGCPRPARAPPPRTRRRPSRRPKSSAAASPSGRRARGRRAPRCPAGRRNRCRATETAVWNSASTMPGAASRASVGTIGAVRSGLRWSGTRRA